MSERKIFSLLIAKKAVERNIEKLKTLAENENKYPII